MYSDLVRLVGSVKFSSTLISPDIVRTCMIKDLDGNVLRQRYLTRLKEQSLCSEIYTRNSGLRQIHLRCLKPNTVIPKIRVSNVCAFACVISEANDFAL